jgi:peptide-methionine (R)-S-oxide reductase
MENPSLGDNQKAVLFHQKTERPFSGALLYNRAAGVYSCANCRSDIFLSQSKYDSGSGWPSFDAALPGSVITSTDTSHGMVRQEAKCANCGGHLGHVFADTRTNTGDYYCINSLALDFSADESEDIPT